jgi:uncharacterized protein YbbC (DUF1343 family)
MKLLQRTLGLLAIVASVATASGQVKTGIDNLVDTDFAMLAGKRIVLVTHAAARTYRGTATAEEFISTRRLTLLRLLAPEHGYYGVVPAGATVADDTVLGVPSISLYGPKRRPDKAMLSGADAVVVDLQDIGVRSYTYISTMVEVLEACAEAGLPCYILDRPNPLGGTVVDGNVPDDSLRSFIGRIPIPYVHGMTMGELAAMTVGEGWLAKDASGTPRTCSVNIVRCKRWKRSMPWEETGLAWYPTSPNIPTITSVRGYALTGLLGELGAVSIGIGTASPFAVIGGPDFPVDTLLENVCATYGVTASSCRFLPMSAKYAGAVCKGYYLSSARTWQPYRAAVGLLWRMRALRPDVFVDTLGRTKHGKMFMKACGSGELLALLVAGRPLRDLERAAQKGLYDFIERRRPYLVYD